jgi:Arc/MetJ-type ribon-helix-helix transcriptional regulator
MTRLFKNRTPREEPVTVLLPEPLASDVDQLLADDKFVEAVKLVRRRTDLNLLPATRAVRHRQH